MEMFWNFIPVGKTVPGAETPAAFRSFGPPSPPPVDNRRTPWSPGASPAGTVPQATAASAAVPARVPESRHFAPSRRHRSDPGRARSAPLRSDSVHSKAISMSTPGVTLMAVKRPVPKGPIVGGPLLAGWILMDAAVNAGRGSVFPALERCSGGQRHPDREKPGHGRHAPQLTCPRDAGRRDCFRCRCTR